MKRNDSPRRFGAGAALLVMAVFLVVFSIGGAAVLTPVVLGMLFSEGGLDPQFNAGLFGGVKRHAMLVGYLVGLGAMLWATRALVARSGVERWREALGLTWGTPRQLLLALAAGLVFGGLNHAAAVDPYLPPPGTVLQPGGALALLSMGLLTVFLGPLTEEIQFRGVLLAGLTASWGVAAASVVVTVGFVAMHLPGDLEGTAWHTAFAIGVLAVRLATGAVGPAFALHAGSNGALFAMSLWQMRALLV